MEEQSEKDRPEPNDNIKRDKIFDNNHRSEFEPALAKEKIRVESTFRDPTIDESVDGIMIESKLEELIQNCKWASDLADASDRGESLTKKEINQVFSLFMDATPSESSIEVFSFACDRYNIKPERFYENLCSEFKLNLHTQLRVRGCIKGGLDDFFV